MDPIPRVKKAVSKKETVVEDEGKNESDEKVEYEDEDGDED